MKPGNRLMARCQFLQENILKDEEIQVCKPLLIQEEALIFSEKIIFVKAKGEQ